MKTERKYKVVNGTSYHENTPDEVINVLEDARQKGTRIRIWYGENGLSWDEENDIIGNIGRSTGTNKIPLLINNARSLGGPGLLDRGSLDGYTGKALERREEMILENWFNFITVKTFQLFKKFKIN